jgi:hypothetical protein
MRHTVFAIFRGNCTEVEIRMILDFGAGFIDWRGRYQNAGA